MILPEKAQNFPVSEYIDEIAEKLKSSSSRCLILTAETGAGKSTILPVGLLKAFDGKILMTEPRRLAVLGAADRISSILGEKSGETCGYRIHLENKISEKTRLEICTEGILVRFLQNDSALEKFNVVILDEFHERSVNLDLALAFLKEALELRDDLFVVIMSATIDTEKIASFMGKDGNAEVKKIKGRTFPVEIEYAGNLSVVEAAIREEKKINEGTILCFEPGISEIRKDVSALESYFCGDDTVEILPLHSSVSFDVQKKVLVKAENGKKRIIVSSAISETSLTIPDVSVVIDSGLSRRNRLNAGSGMNSLVTVVESEFSAVQRSGRAGRIKEGRCVRLWNQTEKREAETEPEILRTSLDNLVLECADRGVFNPETIQWLDKPSDFTWKQSRFLLEKVELLSSDGHITQKGKAALSLGLEPRLSSIALSSDAETLLSSEEGKLLCKYSEYSDSSREIKEKFLSDVRRRILKSGYSEKSCDTEILLLKGYADRLARKTSEEKEKCEFQFPGGKKAVLYGSVDSEWICAPDVQVNAKGAVIFGFEKMKGAAFDSWLKAHLEEKTESVFENGKISKFKRICYGEIVLQEKRLSASSEDLGDAWMNEIKRKGFSALPVSEKTESLLLRLEFLRQQEKSGKNGGMYDGKLIREELIEKRAEWLLPFLSGKTKLDEETVYQALYWFLNGSEIDKKVPEFLILENGKRCKIIYEKSGVIRPKIEVIIQRVFGCFKTPEILGAKVTMSLLSPARRPLQITSDLENFWNTTWIEICKEMKGRYPKHNWDYRVKSDEE